MEPDLNFDQLVKSKATAVSNLRVWSSHFPLPSKVLKPSITFVYASWSGQCVAVFRTLVAELQSEHLQNIELNVVDADCLDYADFAKHYGTFPSSGGWGESFWIVDSKVVFVHGGAADGGVEKLQEICKAFEQQFGCGT